MGIKNWFNFTSNIKKSAGVVIILKESKILLCHATGSKWGGFSPPKGGIDIGESEIDAAIRELREETSIVISKDKITNPDSPIIVDYTYKNGAIYKRLFLYTINIEDISEIGLTSEVVPVKDLQVEEVDWCGFLSKKEAKKLIFHRVSNLLNLINNKKEISYNK